MHIPTRCKNIDVKLEGIQYYEIFLESHLNCNQNTNFYFIRIR